ncbi:leucine-rich repeat domain-containing protein [Pararhodonellum marinum]|uniref:leucine-rich repeat domain-containing protein n=1 Tax=Pararhodonellum marinum TaxID=2755358 RepID=UPI00188FE8E6|nr:leucine-rich repeat domain-containing protein [Pararhodonellum marinum]
MKTNFNKFSVMVIAAFGFATVFSCSSDDEPTIITPEEPEVVNVPDARLEQQIKIALGLDDDEDITEENILELETLTIDGGSDITGEIEQIEDLTGLEFAENLTYLHLGGTSVTDLTPIAGLEKMDYLRLNNTGVTDLSPISNYTTLTYFNINTTTGITDISPLENNTNLGTIIARNVPFGNEGMETIAKLTNLWRLNMRNSGVTDLSVLATLMEGGALQNSASPDGAAILDLRELEVEDFCVIYPYLDEIGDLSGGNFDDCGE